VNAFLAGTGPVTRSWQERHGLLDGLYRYAISRGFVVTSPLPTTSQSCPNALSLIFTHEPNCADSSTPPLLPVPKDIANLSRTRCVRSCCCSMARDYASARLWLSPWTMSIWVVRCSRFATRSSTRHDWCRSEPN
jgi:hypothetical protein